MEMQRILARMTGARDLDALDLLKCDHAAVTELFDAYADLERAEEKETLVARIIVELVIHARIEEELFYPALRRALGDGEIMDGAEIDHAAVRRLMAGLNRLRVDTPGYDARVKELGQQVKDHFKEEESALFSEARDSPLNLFALGGQLGAFRAALESRYELAGAEDEIAAFLAAPTVLRSCIGTSLPRKPGNSAVVVPSPPRVRRFPCVAACRERAALLQENLSRATGDTTSRRSEMGMDQSGTPVLRVVHGKKGGWEVREVGFEKPLASFDSMDDAKDYAEGIARTKAGIVVEVYSEDGRLQSRVSAMG